MEQQLDQQQQPSESTKLPPRPKAGTKEEIFWVGIFELKNLGGQQEIKAILKAGNAKFPFDPSKREEYLAILKRASAEKIEAARREELLKRTAARLEGEKKVAFERLCPICGAATTQDRSVQRGARTQTVMVVEPEDPDEEPTLAIFPAPKPEGGRPHLEPPWKCTSGGKHHYWIWRVSLSSGINPDQLEADYQTIHLEKAAAVARELAEWKAGIDLPLVEAPIPVDIPAFVKEQGG